MRAKRERAKTFNRYFHTEDINPDFTKIYQRENHHEFEGYGIDSVINFIHYVKKSFMCINDRKLFQLKKH